MESRKEKKNNIKYVILKLTTRLNHIREVSILESQMNELAMNPFKI